MLCDGVMKACSVTVRAASLLQIKRQRHFPKTLARCSSTSTNLSILEVGRRKKRLPNYHIVFFILSSDPSHCGKACEVG